MRPLRLITATAFLFGAGLLGLVLLAAPLPAQDDDPQLPAPPKTGGGEGFFLSLSARTLAFKGDLDGKLVLWHFEKAFFSPRLEPAPGFGVGLGIKHDGWLWELAFVRSSHSAELPDRMSRAVYHSVEISGKSFLLKEFPIRPYVLLGISVPWLTVREGSEYQGRRLTASYIGIGVEAGAGFLVDITRTLFVSGGAGWRALGYYYASGEGKGRDITELLNGFEGPRWKSWLKTSTFEATLSLGAAF